jgi:hypothetical protein
LSNLAIRIYRGLFDLAPADSYRDRLRAEHDWSSAAPRSAADHRRAHHESLEEGLGGCPYCA